MVVGRGGPGAAGGRAAAAIRRHLAGRVAALYVGQKVFIILEVELVTRPTLESKILNIFSLLNIKNH